MRIATAPAIRISCVTPAGTQTARWGGTAQLPADVLTSITPSTAKRSWARSWEWGAMWWPSVKSLAMAATGRGTRW